MDLLKDEAVQEKIDEVARLFYSNDTVTINLYWAAAAALLTLLREYPISYDCHLYCQKQSCLETMAINT